MAREYGGISFIVFLPLYFIKFGVERTNNGRLRMRIVRKTKVKELQAVNEDDFYDVMNADEGVCDRVDYGGKLGKQGTNGDGKKRGKKMFRRNKVGPAPEVEAWKKTSGKTPHAANKYICQETCYTSKTVLVEEDGKMTFKRSMQKWDTKTGKEIKLDKNDTNESSSSVSTDPSSFLNVLTPFTTDNFNLCNSHGSPCDLSLHEGEVVPGSSGCPGPSGVPVMNEMVLDLTDGEAWEDTGKRDNKKSMLSSFMSIFKRSGPKTTKVRKFRA